MGSANHSQLSDKAVSGSEAPSGRHAWIINSRAPPPSAGRQSQGTGLARAPSLLLRRSGGADPWRAGWWPAPAHTCPPLLPCPAQACDPSQPKWGLGHSCRAPSIDARETQQAGSTWIQCCDHEPRRKTGWMRCQHFGSATFHGFVSGKPFPSEPWFLHLQNES